MTVFTRADPPPFGDGNFAAEPPSGNGINITDLFHIVEPKPDDPGIDSAVDSQYPNVAIITHDATNQFGGMWAKEQLDLTATFSVEMYLYLGHEYGNSGTPADGMTFTLQNDPAGLNAIGGAGEGLGVYRGRKWTGVADYTVVHGTYLRNSLVVEFDTFRNRISEGAYVDDPGNAGTSHCALLIPKADLIHIEDHKNVFYFTPTQQWVRFEAHWTPNDTGGGTLNYIFNGTQMSYTVDDIIATFGDTKVYWGFTGATGELTAVQAAAITRLPTQEIIAVKTVTNEAGMDLDQSAAAPGDIISYTIRATANQIFTTIGPIIIEDTLSPFVEITQNFVRVTTSAGNVYDVPYELIGSNTIRVNTNHSFTQDGEWVEIKFNVMVNQNAGGNIVYNTSVIMAQGLTEPVESNTTVVTIFPLPEKNVSNTSEAGRDGSAVTLGDIITYDINFVNFEETAVTVFITDVLPTGVDFVSATDGGVYDAATRTVRWTLTNVPGTAEGTVSLSVRVNELAAVSVGNSATVQVGDNAPRVTNRVENPVVVSPPVCPPCPPQCCCCQCCPPRRCCRPRSCSSQRFPINWERS